MSKTITDNFSPTEIEIPQKEGKRIFWQFNFDIEKMSSDPYYLHEELSYEVIGCAFDAFKAVGVGFDEIRYHRVFHEYLLNKGFDAKYKTPVELDYLGKKIGDFEVDEIVENKLIVELKTIQTAFLDVNYAQIMTYLKITDLRLGLLINFGLHKAFPKRIIFDEQREMNTEKWDEGFFADHQQRNLIDSIISLIKRVDRILGVAYYSTVYQNAMVIELQKNKLAFDCKVQIRTEIENIEFKPYKIDYWIVEKNLLLGILAGKDKPRLYDLLRMHSYLKHVNLHHGIIAFWSTRNLQLYGIYEP